MLKLLPMSEAEQEKSQHFRCLQHFGWFAALAAGLLPFLYVQAHIALNTNHAWLLDAARRLLDGGKNVVDVYETNPPLSVVMYMPHVLLHRITGVEIYYTPFAIGLFCLALSCLAVSRILQGWPGVDADTRRLTISLYVLANLFMAGNIHFAERDQIAFLALFPVFLWQVAWTRGFARANGLTYFFLFAGFFLVLVKPHYMIFPAFAFLHRLIVKKSLRPVFADPDFAAFAASAFFYAMIILIFFFDYLTTILRDLLFIYIQGRSAQVVAVPWLVFNAALVPGVSIALVAGIDARLKKASLILFGGAFLGFLLYLIQMKGFYYHAFVGRSFLLMGYGFVLYGLADRYAVKCKNNAGFVTIFLVLVFCYARVPPQWHFPTHEDYKNLKLVQMLKDCEPKTDCRFFVFYENMEMIHQAALYGKATHASRFAGLWWLPVVLAYDQYGTGNDAASSYKNKFMRFVADDLNHWQPDMLAIATNLKILGDENFDFVTYFSQNEAFREAMTHYKKTGVLHDNRGDYFRGTVLLSHDSAIEYDIYHRIKEIKTQ